MAHKFFGLILLLSLLPPALMAAPRGARFEPYVGFKSAAFTSKDQIGGMGLSFEGPISGGLTGFRFGGRFTESYGLGIEFAYGYLDQTNDRVTTKDAGFYVERKFEIPLRAWLTYYFSSEAQSESPGQQASSSGTGTKFGIGYSGFGRISLNVEYLSLRYDKVGAMAQPDAELGSILLSVSSPLDI